MARTRLLKPEFFKSEDVAALPFAGRLLFQGLWTMADRDGRLLDRPRRIQADVFPYDDDPHVDELLAAIAAQGMIVRYVVAGVAIIQITGFAKHQNPHYKEPSLDLPAPPHAHVGQSPGFTGQAASGHDLPPLSGSDPDPVSDPKIGVSARDPSGGGTRAGDHPRRYLDLPAIFAQTRTEVVGGSLDWAKPKTDPQKLREAAEMVAGHEADVAPTMRRFWEEARSDEKLLGDNSLAFGRWRSRFGNLLEAIHGLAPKAAPPARGSPLTDVRIGHARAEQFDHTVTGVQKL
jgi:hypothetical protein